ncbi:MAG TPA: tetratricopeptide repeat protein [Bryobacteraceae bacterium]
MADWWVSTGTPQAMEQALRLTPDREEVLARDAMYRDSSGEQSTAVDEELLRAVRLNPLDSSVLMTLGLREEFRGQSAQAENDLVHAAEIDHQFKPAWTLANYYYRDGRPDKSWPMIERILKLDPLGFDPAPVFALCWNQTSNASQILSLIPKTGHRPVQYLEFLMKTQRADAAFAAWPEALAAADPSDPYDSGQMRAFADFLVNADRSAEAVTVWNQLVDRGIVSAGHLDPAKGISIADPDFRHPSLSNVFGWHVAEVSGVLTDGFSGSLRLEIDGNEPESFQMLSTSAPVLSGTRYSLQWKSDGSGVRSPHDPGFSFVVSQRQVGQTIEQTSEAVTQCPPLLAPGDSACGFVTSGTRGEMGEVRIDLRYARAQGTTRVSGTLQLSAVTVRPEFAK